MSAQATAVKFISKGAVSAAKNTFSGQSFLKTLTDAALYVPKAYKKIASDSFVSSVQKAFTHQKDEKILSNLFLPIVGGAILNGGAVLYTTLNMFEDKRRLFNLGGMNSEQFTDPYAALNTYYLSAGATALGAIPLVGGASELAGSALQNSSKANAVTGLAGKGLSNIGKGINTVTKGALKVTGLAGKGLDLVVKGAGALVGKDINTKAASKLMGKQYLWIHGLIAARMLYKYLSIDLPKRPKRGLANMAIGGKILGYDNDPNSPTYLQSVNFKSQLQKRLIAEKQGLPGAELGAFAQRQFRQLSSLV